MAGRPVSSPNPCKPKPSAPTPRLLTTLKVKYLRIIRVPPRRQVATSNQYFLMNTGTVKFFNEAKGFGFIVDSSSQEEIFVHVTGLIDNIREGDTVTFSTARGKKGMNAVDVKIA
jgi:CspA family cold shock protein